ncbi:MAG: geranylgeranylglycerol-phosphate geranylgeranyltransferase [Candidatus Zixiibacteriota bacterium]|nr:MAG: geranylgeranylglycerol-phosphate geranylgeranyltransferase [candidate division Zixibacteria bacterium]
MQHLVPLIKLIRLHNCLLAGAGVWIGGYLSNITGRDTEIYLASLAAALVCGAGNALNDYVDREADRTNHPVRPLPAGKLPAHTALLTAALFNVLAIAAGGFVNISVLGVVLASIALLILYNVQLKGVPVIGNILVSILAGGTFMTGGLAAGGVVFALPGPIAPAIFAFLFHLGRELLKDVADYEGDKEAGLRTLPLNTSLGAVMGLVTVIYITLILLTFVPIYLKWFSSVYGFMAVLAVDVPLVMVIGYLWFSKSAHRQKRACRALKLLMLFGLLAFVGGKS